MKLTDIKKFILLAGDVCVFYLALFLSLWARLWQMPSADVWNKHWPAFTFICVVWIVVFFVNGFYDLQKTRNNIDFFRSFLATTVFNFLLSTAFFYIVDLHDITPKTILVLLTIIYGPLFALWRLGTQKFLLIHVLQNKALFIGLAAESIELITTLHRNPQLGYRVVGVMDGIDAHLSAGLPEGVSAWNSTEPLDRLIHTHHIDTVAVAPFALTTQITRALYRTLFARVQVFDLISFYEMVTHRVPVLALSEAWFLENLKENQKLLYDRFKTIADALLGICMACVCGIVLIPASIAIYAYDRGPVFIKQRRVGRDGRIFNLYKFRTMVVDAEKHGAQFTLPKDARITAVGRFLRLTRIDELPQAVNILRGEMSVIGPRPERPEFVHELEEKMPFYQVRHLIKPGLTGWAQINRAYYATPQEHLIKLQYDLYYIKHRSLLLDGAILLKTIRVVVKWLGR